MTFTTPCFVRVENAEERDALICWGQDLGYRIVHLVGFPLAYWISAYNGNMSNGEKHWSGIDCGTDVELFRALAAMNDETDFGQWFTDGDEWLRSDYNDFDGCMTTAAESAADNVGYYTFCQEYGFHKATAKEIIEHFKNRNNERPSNNH